MSIDPRGMDVITWTNRMTPLLDSSGPVSRLLDPNRWKEWATEVLDNLAFQGVVVPDPNQFNDWMQWAIRFNQIVDLPG